MDLVHYVHKGFVTRLQLLMMNIENYFIQLV
jgi:hypothetical protein